MQMYKQSSLKGEKKSNKRKYEGEFVRKHQTLRALIKSKYDDGNDASAESCS